VLASVLSSPAVFAVARPSDASGSTVAVAARAEHSRGMHDGPAPLAIPFPIGNRAADLLRRHASGDRQAFAELVSDHQDAAFATAYGILGDRSLAGDIVQDAFLRLLRDNHGYQTERPFRPWFMQIVRNLAIDQCRRRRPVEGVERLADVTAAEAPGAVDHVELRRRVTEVLGELPEKYRVILVMRELEGVAAEAIANHFDLDYATTRWRLHQARKLFRAAWLARFPEDTP